MALEDEWNNYKQIFGIDEEQKELQNYFLSEPTKNILRLLRFST